MIKKIYLHIGFHKTGSTSIQNSLLKSTELLSANNFLFPVMTQNNQPISNQEVVFCSLVMNNPETYYGNIVAGCSEIEQILRLNEHYLLEFSQQIESFEGDNLIISGEGISILKIEELSRLQQLFFQVVNPDVSIEVIVFMRNPLAYSCSLCQERIKNGNALISDLVLYEQSNYRYYAENLLRVEQVFGRENIKLFRFEDAIEHPVGLVGFFLSIIGFNNSLIACFESVHENKSISHEAVVLLSAINEEIPLIIDGKLNPQRSSNPTIAIRAIPGIKFLLTNEQSRKVWKNATKDLDWIYENYKIDHYQYFEMDESLEQKQWSDKTLLYIKNLLPALSDDLQQIIVQKIREEKAVDIIAHSSRSSRKSLVHRILKLFMRRQ